MTPGHERGPAAHHGVPFVRPDVPDFAEVAPDLAAALESGMLTKGPFLARLEAEAAALLGVRHVVGVSSCTVGLALVLKSLAEVRAGSVACPTRATCPLPVVPARDAGGGDRREVILPSFIFLAAPAAVAWAGLEPVFVDVDPATFTLDPAAAAAAVTDRTAAIMACHTFGCPCDVAALEAVATRAGVPLLVDAAHALGTTRQAGGQPRQVGAGGLAQVFSMSPTKLVVAGEGGLVATDCDCLAAAVRTAREYGNDGAYGCTVAGLNGRLPEFSAVLALASLARLDGVAHKRRAAAAAYADALAGGPGIVLQRIPADAESSWKDFVVGIDPARAGIDRDGLREALAARGIDTRAYYSPAYHAMEAFARCRVPAAGLPVTDRLSAMLLALPMGAHVTPDVARGVAGVVREIVVEGAHAAGARA